MNKVPLIAKSKVQRFQKNRLVAWLTPAECLYLISIGCVPERDDMEELEGAAFKKGQSHGSWIYWKTVTFSVDKIWKP